MHLKEACATPIYESSSWCCTEEYGTGRYSRLYEYHLSSHALPYKELQVGDHLDLGDDIHSTDDSQTSQRTPWEDPQSVSVPLLSREDFDDRDLSSSFDPRLNQIVSSLL